MPVFLFPGQGAQFSGMGMDLVDADAVNSIGIRSFFAEAGERIGTDIVSLLSSSDESLKRTDVSQVSITACSLAAALALKARGILPSACAGFSLGEYPALAVAGVISFSDAIFLTKERGRIMQAACDAIASSGSAIPGMAAVLGLSPEKIDEVIASLGIPNLFGANYNSPLQTVISGTSEALDAAEGAFKEAGARRVLRLKVAGPFHSPLMAKAGVEFAKVLEGVPFNDPAIPLFSNVTGSRVMTGADAKARAVEHISNPVRWTAEEAAISALAGETCECVEVGPGKVLSGLWADSKLPGTCKPYADYLAN